MYQKIVILAYLVLKRILEYSLGAQKKFEEYLNTKSYYSFKPYSKQTAITEEVLMLLYLLPFYLPPNSGSDGPNQQSVQRKSPCPKVLFLSNFIPFKFDFFSVVLTTPGHKSP